MTAARKPRVHVDQGDYTKTLAAVGGLAHLHDIAEHHDVSTASARRALDGLVYQGRVLKTGRGIYALAGGTTR